MRYHPIHRPLAELTLAACTLLLLATAPGAANAQRMRTGGNSATAGEAPDSLPAEPARQARAPSPYASWEIIPDSISGAPATTLSELLQGRVPGLSVQRLSGASGSASNVLLRGARSTVTSNTPLIIVDGIRFETERNVLRLIPESPYDATAEWTSPLDDLSPEDVDRVEVFSGPASAALVDESAPAGVIFITTKRARREGLHWRAHAGFGTASQANDFPSSYDQRGIAYDDGERLDYCGIDEQSRSLCYPLPDSLLSSNALERYSPFRTGTRSQLGISGGAANENAAIHIAGDFTRDDGTLDFNYDRRDHLLVNTLIKPLPELSVAIHAGYTRGALSGIAPASDWGVLRSGMAGGPDVPRGYLVSPDTLAAMATLRSTAHLAAGSSVTWLPIRWLRVTGLVGVDHGSWVSDKSLLVWTADPNGHSRTNFTGESVSTRLTAAASWNIGNAFRTDATLGIAGARDREYGRTIMASNNGGLYDSTMTMRRAHDKVASTFGRVDVAWEDRLTLSAGLRHDRITRVYRPLGAASTTDPSIGIAWRVSNEPWYPRNAAVATVTLHAAHGAGRPVKPLTLPASLDDDWTPVSRESEVGVDVAGLDGRARLTLGYYRGESDDVDLGSPLPPPDGAMSAVDYHGLEAAISAAVVQRDEIEVDLSATAAFPRTRYRGVTLLFGSFDGDPQRHVSGYPIAGYWAPPILGYRDQNGDQMIGTAGCTAGDFPSDAACEVQLGAPTYVGSSLPTRELSLRPRITHHRFTVSGLFEYRGGQKLFNQTEYYRCRYYRVCRGGADRQAPLADQARAAASVLGSPAGFIEDASFWKLRELAISMAAPTRWAAVVGAEELRFTMAARNLATWTGYTGQDPELNSAGYQTLASIDSFSQPIARSIMLRLDLGW